jgi:hypothetical protein
VRAPERMHGTRVVASPAVLDAREWPDGAAALRLAADDLLLIGAALADMGDASAIVEEERGFVGWWLSSDELRDRVMPHVEWPLPDSRPAFAQGLIAGVPAKLWLAADRSLVLCQAAYAHELEERLG